MFPYLTPALQLLAASMVSAVNAGQRPRLSDFTRMRFQTYAMAGSSPLSDNRLAACFRCRLDAGG
jgi:hypothetical protein